MNDRFEAGPLESPDFQGTLARIDRALALGAIEESLALASHLRVCARDAASSDAGAETALRLAICDYHSSHLQRALQGAEQAAALFCTFAPSRGEVQALSLASRAASTMGRKVHAIEAALLATRLADDLPGGLWTVGAFLSLGTAYGWGHRYAKAEEAFDKAAQIAVRYGGGAAQLEVMVERLWVRAARFIEEREGQEGTDWSAAAAEVAKLLDRHKVQDGGVTVTPGAAVGLTSSSALLCSLMTLWSDGVDQARTWLGRVDRSATGLGSPVWLAIAESGVRAEIARRVGDHDAATIHASRMVAWSIDQERLPFARIGHLLASDVYALQGRSDLAHKELRRLVSVERRMQARDLDARDGFIEHRLALRQSQRHIENLTAESGKFWRWAHEDELTGLANLRRFDQCLTDWSAAATDAERPLCVAILDVDHFKQVNDTIGHDAGNEVLRRIAELMRAHVREVDLPSRWGGDEFAILFRDVDKATADQVAERIGQSVSQNDWSGLTDKLRVSVSIGVVEAMPGDTKQSLVKRADEAMYATKRAREAAEAERAVPRAVIQRVAGWLKQAQRVVLFVGAGSAEDSGGAATGANLAAWSPHERAQFGNVLALQRGPDTVRQFWHDWRRAHEQREPLPAHRNIVALSRHLRQATFVTERVDGLLARAGAQDVVELYGNAFQDRCSACGRVRPGSDGGNCLACGATEDAFRPNVVLLGEWPDSLVLAGTELQFKRSDVVLVVDCEATTFPGAGLIDKAKSRHARVVAIGTGSGVNRECADATLRIDSTVILKVLTKALEQATPFDDVASRLTPAGFDVLCFLTGHGADDRGSTLEQALGWSNWEIEHRLAILAWMFPLHTQSRINPDAPAPTRDDFAVLATDADLRAGMRRALMRMLHFYGFEWRDGQVQQSGAWREGFAAWALEAGPHDLLLSRILGALTLCGLREEAAALLRALERTVQHYRADDSEVPLSFWRLAVQG